MNPDQADAVFVALADPCRREIVTRLARWGRQRTGDLLKGMEMSRQGASRHLGILETSGLVTSHRVGRVVYRELNLEPLRGTAQWLTRIDQEWSLALNRLKASFEAKDVEESGEST